MHYGAIRLSFIALVASALAAVITLVVWLNPAGPEDLARANHQVAIGIDTDTTGNTALSLGAVQEACRVLTLNDIIDVDLYVKGLDDLASWEAYVQYDAGKIKILAPGDNNQNNNARFLLQQAQPTPPGNNLFNSSETLPDTNQPGIYRVGAADMVVIPGTEDPDPINHTHMDGVLVRFQVQALSGFGFSPFDITQFDVGPGTLGPVLVDSSGNPVGDTSVPPDSFFDGPITNGQFVLGTGSCTDSDGDGIPDTVDNCPAIQNPDQADNDNDDIGDVCDIDDDNDGLVDTSEPVGCEFDPDCDDDLISDGANDPDGGGPIASGADNCILIANNDQTNTDGDAEGDACDADDDNDTFLDTADNCPLIVNSGQENFDGDSLGDACDPEKDGDGFDNDVEAWVGTNDLDPCGEPTASAPIFSQSWPGDLWSTGLSANKAEIQDLTSFLAPARRINTSPGDGDYNIRWDLKPGPGPFGDDINIQDLTTLITFTALMFNNERAFNYTTPCTP